MAFLSGYKNDVFVSYAHADNQPMLDTQVRWVSNFIDDLEKCLIKKLGRKDGMVPSICMDGEFAFNIPLNESVFAEIQNSAVYLIIMSPAYLESDWCLKERQQVYKILKDRGNTARVFIVEIDEVNRKRYPIEINEYIIPYQFWKKEGHKTRQIGFPKRDDAEYSNRLIDISADLAKELISIKKNGNYDLPVQSINKSVFLAQVTDDLDEKREEIKRFLKDEGFTIFPEQNWYFTDEVSYLKPNIHQHLSNCSIYIQLLSNLTGKKLPDRDDTIATLQFAIAKECNKKMMVWRSPSLNIGSIHIGLKKIHESEYVRSEGFEEFKIALLHTLKEQDQEKKVEEAKSKFVYVCTDIVDKLYCDQTIVPNLRAKKIDYSYPLLSSKNVSMVRKYQEENLLHCDAAVFIYCDSDPDIVFSQIMHCRKVNTERKEPFKVIAIYDGPPPEKDKIELSLHNINFSYLNCRESQVEFTDKFLNILLSNDFLHR